MGWLNDWLADLGEPQAPPIAKPEPRPAKPEIKSVWFQIRGPTSAIDLGEVDAGHYSVADGLLRMHDPDGRPTGKEYRLRPDENERAVAGRLAKAAWVKARGHTDFNRTLHYPTQWIV